MLMAVLLNEIHNKYFKKVSQTLMFLPYFISQVLVGFLVFNLLNYDTGFINGIVVGVFNVFANNICNKVCIFYRILYGHQS